ncbi:MAG: dTDP-glucose 4,6-dehydratase [Phycisphaerae bacterium]|nr:dTDP-glucose 4,6-dehydratase [Phycisphaerae bacterium]
MKRLLVTGGAGFIGSNFVRWALRNWADVDVVNLDVLTYAGNLANLSDVEGDGRYTFMHGDITDAALLDRLMGEGIDAVINFAAESHVDRSLMSSEPFVRTNVVGTQQLLDAARRHGVERFLQVSTDEVYGSLGAEGEFTETTPLCPNSPYSASKAAADLLCHAYHHSLGFPAMISRCSNNYGPYQFPEKVIPLFLTNLFEGRKVPLYGDGLNVRDWIYVEDHCAALGAILEKGSLGEVYNVGADCELTNLDLTKRIIAACGRDEDSIEYVKDRPGHDRRYAIDSSKIRGELGWSPAHDFDDALARTVRWYRDHEDWWRGIKSGEYREYYQKQYGGGGGV